MLTGRFQLQPLIFVVSRQRTPEWIDIRSSRRTVPRGSGALRDSLITTDQFSRENPARGSACEDCRHVKGASAF